MLFVKIRVQEMFKEFPVQIAKIIRNAKFITVFIVLLKQHAKIVIAYVGGKIVSYNPQNVGQFYDQQQLFPALRS